MNTRDRTMLTSLMKHGMLQNSPLLRIVTKFSTNPQNTHLKIYSDYKIDFKITGDFNYLTK